MSKIKILSEHIANQIAAGEVIERPASVVKEFLENSIDAKASQISIQIDDDGTRLIRVIDNGEGMDQDDVLLCLERHATSKLTDSSQGNKNLIGINTLGFRGEAIPSIASVSKLVITSRPTADSLGTRAEVRYGKMVKVHDIGSSRGTVMEVRDLFGNMPARKKFLKTRRTELGHIEEIVKNYCLANSELGITYSVNNSIVFSLLPETDGLEKRVKWLMGRKPDSQLIRIDSSAVPGGDETAVTDHDSVTIQGYLVPPDEIVGPAAKLRLFVNGRSVRNRMIIHAVSEGLAGFLLKGRSPAGALFLSLPPESIDVNVHPTKWEVRFQKPNVIHQIVALAVRQAIEQYQDQLKFSLFGRSSEIVTKDFKDETEISFAPDAEELKETGWQPTREFQVDQVVDRFDTDHKVAEPFSSYGVGDWGKQKKRAGQPDIYQKDKPIPAVQHNIETTVPFPSTVYESDSKKEVFSPIGQLMDLYILCEHITPHGNSLVVIDQHAVHERLLFEGLKNQFAESRVASQTLLFPQMIECTLQQVQILKKHQKNIESLGVTIEEFGEESYAVKAVPVILSHLSAEEIMTSLFDQFDSFQDEREDKADMSAESRIDAILASMACKAAVKAGRMLASEEITSLLKQMQEADIFSHCPHGRPVFKTFNASDIRKWFHRT